MNSPFLIHLKLIGSLCAAAILLSNCTTDTKLGITTTQGPRVQETQTR